jgi:hypothetical protein
MTAPSPTLRDRSDHPCCSDSGVCVLVAGDFAYAVANGAQVSPTRVWRRSKSRQWISAAIGNGTFKDVEQSASLEQMERPERRRLDFA